jgi:hypothetical protein
VAYLCDGTGDANAIAEATAEAFAAAVVSVVAECVLVGNATAKVTALANARAQAEVWVNSYFSASAFSSDCKTCNAFASSYGYISKYVFLEAIAAAEVTVCHQFMPSGKTCVQKYPANWTVTCAHIACFEQHDVIVLAFPSCIRCVVVLLARNPVQMIQRNSS